MYLIVAFLNVSNTPKALSITSDRPTDAGIYILKLKRYPMLKNSMQEAGLHFIVNQDQKSFFFKRTKYFLKKYYALLHFVYFKESWRYTFSLHDIPANFPGYEMAGA
jgi:hypothetical protein